MTAPGSTALTVALDGEQAAIFAYGVIGARLKGADAKAARAAEAAHRGRRDSLLAVVDSAAATPPGYTLPFPVRDRASALRLAVQVEERTGALWRAALRETDGDRRRDALAALTDCAVRATRWRRAAAVTPTTVPFPGAP